MKTIKLILKAYLIKLLQIFTYNNTVKVDTLIIKYGFNGDFIDNEVYEIKIDYTKCVQIISVEQGILSADCNDFLKSIDGETIEVIYKGKSRMDDMNIFLISPIQIYRQIKLNQIL